MENPDQNGPKLITLFYYMDGVKLMMGLNIGRFKIVGELNGEKMVISEL
jgi:hypothetical protein